MFSITGTKLQLVKVSKFKRLFENGTYDTPEKRAALYQALKQRRAEFIAKSDLPKWEQFIRYTAEKACSGDTLSAAQSEIDQLVKDEKQKRPALTSANPFFRCPTPMLPEFSNGLLGVCR